MEDDEIKALEKEISILRKVRLIRCSISAIQQLSKTVCFNLSPSFSLFLQLKHRNICMMREVFQDKDMLYIIMEEMTGGELFHRILKKEFYCESEAAKV